MAKEITLVPPAFTTRNFLRGRNVKRSAHGRLLLSIGRRNAHTSRSEQGLKITAMSAILL